MQNIATLIANPARPAVTVDRAEAARATLAERGRTPGDIAWLAPNEACDIPFDGGTGGVRDLLSETLAELPIDVVVQPAEGRRKALLVADMESTIIVNEMVDELAELVGVRARVAEITAKAMNGELGFRPALKERVALLGGLEEEVVKQARKRIRFTPGALTLVKTMKANGAGAALVSGGFDVYCDWVKERAGFDHTFSNTLVVHDGIVTGELTEPIMGRDSKRESMEHLAEEAGIGLDAVLAVGDGANDIDMLSNAGMGVAYHAKPAVAAAAPARIDYADLRGLLYIQGYAKTDFVEPD